MVISETLVGSFLVVFFLSLAVILSELHEKPRRKDCVTEKRMGGMDAMGGILFDYIIEKTVEKMEIS